jgi:hypothetical protein
MLNLVVKNKTSWVLKDEDQQLPYGNFRGGSRILWGLKLLQFWGPFLRKGISNYGYKIRYENEN